jgi:hypothetical protein
MCWSPLDVQAFKLIVNLPKEEGLRPKIPFYITRHDDRMSLMIRDTGAKIAETLKQLKIAGLCFYYEMKAPSHQKSPERT